MSDSIEISGEKMKALRERNRFSQANVADYLKVDQSLMSKVEKGSRTLTSDMLEKLAVLYGVHVSGFAEGETPAKPLSFALRANEINASDLETIAAIKRVALNSNFMTQLLEGVRVNG